MLKKNRDYFAVICLFAFLPALACVTYHDDYASHGVTGLIGKVKLSVRLSCAKINVFKSFQAGAGFLPENKLRYTVT
jgi:hypothetical protein